MLNSSQSAAGATDSQQTRAAAGADDSQDAAHMFDLDAEVEPVPPETTQLSQLPGASPDDDVIGGGGGDDGQDDFGAVDDDDVALSDGDRSLHDYHMGDGQAAKIFNKAMDDIKYVA